MNTERKKKLRTRAEDVSAGEALWVALTEYWLIGEAVDNGASFRAAEQDTVGHGLCPGDGARLVCLM